MAVRGKPGKVKESRERWGREEVDTVAVLVEEAEGLLELCYLVVAELVRHGDEASRRLGKQKQGMLRASVNGYCARRGRVFVRETGRRRWTDDAASSELGFYSVEGPSPTADDWDCGQFQSTPKKCFFSSEKMNPFYISEGIFIYPPQTKGKLSTCALKKIRIYILSWILLENVCPGTVECVHYGWSDHHAWPYAPRGIFLCFWPLLFLFFISLLFCFKIEDWLPKQLYSFAMPLQYLLSIFY